MKEAVYDIVALVPGRNEKAALEGILSRQDALGIRPVRYAIDTHPDRDPGCRLRAVDHLKSAIGTCRHAIVLFDHEGSGAERTPAAELETNLEKKLSEAGWQDRAACIVIEPELEIWLWSDSPHVDAALGWRGRVPGLREWLRQHGRMAESAIKPCRPKEAVEAAMRLSGKRRTSAIYQTLAEQVSLSRCQDRAFLKLKATLQGWFPSENSIGRLRETSERYATANSGHYVSKDLVTERVIGAAIEVHRTLGPGLLESIYEEALCIELGLRGIPYKRQAEVAVHYKGHALKGQKVDLLVEDAVVVELKAVSKLPDVAMAQVLSYLKATGLKRGLLVNFGEGRLVDGVKRVSL